MLNRNRFLDALGEDLDIIRPHLRDVRLPAGHIICEPGDHILNVYFPLDGMVSKLAVFRDGTEIECALIGRDGAVGATAAIGMATSVTRDVCHVSTWAVHVELAVLKRAASHSPHIRTAIEQYCAWKMGYVMRNGACNARHSVDQRLCRWLLTSSDVLQSTQINMHQDLFARMLGVQRTTINPILQRFRAEGILETGRGRVAISDRGRLKDRACECYSVMKGEKDFAPQPAFGARAQNCARHF